MSQGPAAGPATPHPKASVPSNTVTSAWGALSFTSTSQTEGSLHQSCGATFPRTHFYMPKAAGLACWDLPQGTFPGCGSTFGPCGTSGQHYIVNAPSRWGCMDGCLSRITLFYTFSQNPSGATGLKGRPSLVFLTPGRTASPPPHFLYPCFLRSLTK